MYTDLEILLVEDNEGDVEMTRRALRTAKPQCRLTVANNGDQAIRLLQEGAAQDGGRPHLILLDINMPRMDGKAFLSVIKQDDAFRAIPVVMFTSSESPTDIRECYERHASCYVVKPFDGVQYANTVREVVHFWGEIGQLPS
jgi:CheY-like chemotaxis protein